MKFIPRDDFDSVNPNNQKLIALIGEIQSLLDLGNECLAHLNTEKTPTNLIVPSVQEMQAVLEHLELDLARVLNLRQSNALAAAERWHLLTKWTARQW